MTHFIVFGNLMTFLLIFAIIITYKIGLIQMLILWIIHSSLILVFVLLFFITRKTNKRWSKINDYLGTVTNTVNSVRYGNLTTKIDKIDHPTYQTVTDSINRMVETLNDREKMIIEYQAELMRQNKLLESVINSLSDGILIINEDFDILRATPKVSTWFGVKGKDLIGKNIQDFIQTVDDTPIKKLNGETIFIKHTSTNNFIANAQKLTTDDKKQRYVLLIKDITKEKELEKLKEDFVATLTHDLKVPIVAGANIVEFLLAEKFGEINEKQRIALNNMQASNKELIDLVQILLETYKIDEKGIVLSKESIVLDTFIADIILETQPIANKSGISIKFQSDKKLTVMADPTQITRILKNLISNAILHSSTKDIEIEIGEIQGFITISVIDYGQGIPQKEIKNIFNKYYSAANKFRKIGTGLGLYLSQQIANAHGGEITVESEENVRTCFCLKLPI